MVLRFLLTHPSDPVSYCVFPFAQWDHVLEPHPATPSLLFLAKHISPRPPSPRTFLLVGALSLVPFPWHFLYALVLLGCTGLTSTSHFTKLPCSMGGRSRKGQGELASSNLPAGGLAAAAFLPASPRCWHAAPLPPRELCPFRMMGGSDFCRS